MHNLWQKHRDICLVSHALCSRGSAGAAHHFVSQLLFVFAFLHGPLHAVPPQTPFKLCSAGFLTLQVAIIIIIIIISFYFSASGRYRATKRVWSPAVRWLLWWGVLSLGLRRSLSSWCLCSWVSALAILLLKVSRSACSHRRWIHVQTVFVLPDWATCTRSNGCVTSLQRSATCL